jgi:hypothetical protein
MCTFYNVYNLIIFYNYNFVTYNVLLCFNIMFYYYVLLCFIIMFYYVLLLCFIIKQQFTNN